MARYKFYFTDGTKNFFLIKYAHTVEPERIIGITKEFRLVKRINDDLNFGLTLCCNALDKELDGIVVCRGCYDTFDVGEYDPEIHLNVFNYREVD